jgi:hypothetical protein
MIGDKIPAERTDRLEQGSPKPVKQQPQQSQGSAKTPPERRIAPGRLPLFRR